MSDTSNNAGKKSLDSLPLTEAEKAEGFKLLEKLLIESARQEILREMLAESLEPKQDPQDS